MPKAKQDMPTDDDVVAALWGLNGVSSASALCDVLAKDYPRDRCQLAIQRAMDRSLIATTFGWNVRIVTNKDP